MKNIVFIGAHLGFPMDRTPLGGGAMVGLHLVREWAGRRDIRLVLLGAGPEAPAPGVEYLRLPSGGSAPSIVKFTELQYAAFCRDFEAATTEHLLGRRRELRPEETVLLVNDIAESPDLGRLAREGYPIVTLWHVDVVDYFNRIYLRDLVGPERWTRLFERLRRRRLDGVLPDMLRIIFDKQRAAVESSSLMVLPSRQMGEAIRRCYPPAGGGTPAGERTLVLPWGVWTDGTPPEEAEAEAARLRAHYQLGPESMVLMTLSRISREKGLHLLLEALLLLERSGRLEGLDLCLFICGEAAFMGGEAYAARVRRAAARLRRTRVFFPGYLAPSAKQAYFRLARLFVSPSIHESYGLTLVEALRAGLPVLASDHYGVEETLKPGYSRTVPYAKAGARAAGLASAVEELVRDPRGLSRMGAAARKAAEGMRFEDTARKLLERALGLLKPGGDRPALR